MWRFLDTATTTGATSHTEEEEHLPEFISFGVLILALSVGIVTRSILAKWIPIPYTVLLLIWGGIFGIWYTEVTEDGTEDGPFNDALNNSIRTWLSVDPRVLQIIFLPILIFTSAFNAQFHILERRLGQIIFLAVPGVIIGAVLTATFMKYALPYGWDWNLSLVFGAMVAATDPVAVVALLEELGVSEKLGTLIEGESLFNDGSAIVVFEVFLEAVEGMDRTWYEVVEFGARLALGGPALGACLGLLGAFLLGYVINDPLVEVSITIVLSFSTFALCEATKIKVSGVLGVVACGVMLSYYGKPRVSSSVLPSLRDFWRTLQFFADTTIFFLSGLIVVGVAISSDRAIDGEDWGYLLALFVVLYIIRGFVVLLAYPVLRSGEYKITVPQMMVLTHSGLRGAVALILALAVDSVPDIDKLDRDKIVFHTAGVAVLSLLLNGTTTGVLVRYLKLDRASEASASVFDNACFALELAMEKQNKLLKEDPFLGDANWPLVWRYLPMFTADCYWHRLSKGHIVLSREEVDDVLEANSRSSLPREEVSLWQRWMEALRYSKGGITYKEIPHRLRSTWYNYNTELLFAKAGGLNVWGDLETFLLNHSAGDDHGEAWTGHLRHSTSHVGELEDQGASVTAPSNNDDTTSKFREVHFGGAISPQVSFTSKPEPLDHPMRTPASSAHGSDQYPFGRSRAVTPGEELGGEALGSDKVRTSTGSSSYGAGSLRKRTLSSRMSHRAESVVKERGMSVEHEVEDGNAPVKESEVIEARMRFLNALKAEYVKAKRHGKLGSGGLRVLREGIHNAMDKVDHGQELDCWSELTDHYKPGVLVRVAKYLNWFPARPITAAAIARRLSFQLEIAWNFLEAHHQANVRILLEHNGKMTKVGGVIDEENKKQIDLVEDEKSTLTAGAPLVARSVTTRTAARVMIQRYREAVEVLASNGHLDEKEEEKLLHAVTDTELKIAYHPNLETLPPLEDVIEKVEFLLDLSPEERERLIEVGAAYYQEYVGEVELIERGSRGIRRGNIMDDEFRGWFYVVRGNVEKATPHENGDLCYRTYSAGLLFGITDTMLGIPHHADYMTHGFSNVVVFDCMKLLEEAKNMPALDRALWASVGAHTLRRSERFSRFKLSSVHGLMDRAEMLSGKGDKNESETVWLAEGEALTLVRGRILSSTGVFSTSTLGHMDATVAPLLLENPVFSESGSCSLKLTGDFKALRIEVEKLLIFLSEERGRLTRQATIRRRSMSMSAVSDDANELQRMGREEDSQVESLKELLENSMEGPRWKQEHRGAMSGVKAAVRLIIPMRASE